MSEKAGRRWQWIWLAVPVVMLVGGAGVLWSVLAEYDPAPPCPALPAPAADAGSGQQAVAANGDRRPAFGAPVTAGPLIAAAYLTDDRPNSTGYVLTAGRRGYQVADAEPVSDVVPAPDGSRVAVLPDVGIPPTDHPGGPVPGKRIGLYDVARGKLTWTPLPDNALKAAFSPDSARLAVSIGTPYAPDPEPIRLVIVDLGSGGQRLVEPTAEDTHMAGHLDAVNWLPDGRLLLSSSDQTSVHTLEEGAGRVLATVPLAQHGVSPNGRRGVTPDGTVVDLQTGVAERPAVFGPCQDHGIDRSFTPAGWYDDDELLAVQWDVEWAVDHRRGEPKRAAEGSRLVVTDLDGRVSRVVVGWNADLPRMMFARASPAG
jgi:hypothetical protein